MDTTHNLPPLPTAESLLASLKADNPKLIERHKAFGEAMARLPVKIENEADAEKCADMAAQLKAGFDMAEGKRTETKRPYDELSKVVHGFFSGIGSDFYQWRTTVFNRVDAYQKAKREAERQRLEAEAAAKRAEADRLAEAGNIDAATQVAEKALATEQAAASPSAGATRGAYGGVLGSRTTWEFEVLDVSKLPKEHLMPNMPGIRAAVQTLNKHKQLKDGQENTALIPGVRIFQKTSTTGR